MIGQNHILLEGACDQFDRLHASFEQNRGREDEIVKPCCELIGFESENPPHLLIEPRPTDARFIINKLEIPTVCFGPVSETSDSSNEYVMKEDLTLCLKMQAAIIMEYQS